MQCVVHDVTPELLLTDLQAEETWLLAPSTDHSTPRYRGVIGGGLPPHLISILSHFYSISEETICVFSVLSSHKMCSLSFLSFRFLLQLLCLSVYTMKSEEHKTLEVNPHRYL